jgi:hypothetical protein
VEIIAHSASLSTRIKVKIARTLLVARPRRYIAFASSLGTVPRSEPFRVTV